uniref:Uncharacterized protein n=1 Tax=Branchiostoma floridae TaxID=7739 RepID=C3Y5Y7_BRAFL|eukprot:XP_002608374.1 hypothetical protein BRAFLDRAFT_91333 [Branchiostoma floridae]
MATGASETLDDRLERIKDDLKRVYSLKLEETEDDEDQKESACWDIYDLLMPNKLLPLKFPEGDTRRQFKIDFNKPQTLGDDLLRAISEVESLSENAKNTIRRFVKHINKNEKPIDSLEAAKDALKSVKAQKYIVGIIVNLSANRQIKWDTKSGNTKVDDVSSWKFDYEARKQLEGAVLHSSCQGSRPVPRKPRLLMPLIYWQCGTEDALSWAEYNSNTGEVKAQIPPSWATDKIDCIKQKIINQDMQQFAQFTQDPKVKPYVCQDRNAVYLLLCRFNEGVPEEARVQAYAGKATNGVEERWLQHARKSKHLMQNYRLENHFKGGTLHESLLVEVIIGRLYAQGGNTYLVDNSTLRHDNVALFVYCTGANTPAGKDQQKHMEHTEASLIKNLELTDMKNGLNKRLET